MYLICKVNAFVLLTAVVVVVDGARKPAVVIPDVCLTMDPGLGKQGATPQRGPAPYHLLLDNHTVTSDSESSVGLTVRGQAPHVFTGFMVQARPEGEDRPVGVFTGGDNIHLMECFGEPNNTATHVDTDLKDAVTLRWTPDSGYQGDVVFYVTIVKNIQQYWVKLMSQPVTVE